MAKLYWLLISNLFRRSSMQWLIVVSLLAIGIFSSLTYQTFIYLQSQNISQLSVFNQVIKPVAGITLFMQLLLACLGASSLLPYFSDRGQKGLFVHSPISTGKLALLTLLLVITLSLIPFIYFIAISLGYVWASDIDINLLFSTSSALLISVLLFNPLIISVVLFFRKTLTAFVVSILAVVTIFAIDQLITRVIDMGYFSIGFSTFVHLRDGLVNPAEIMSTFLWLVIFIIVLMLSLNHFLIRTAKFIYLALICSVLLLAINGKNYLITEDMHWDISSARLNSLDQFSAKKISQIDSKIVITAVIDDEKNHDEIQQAFDIIRQYHSETQLKFSNRQAESKNSDLVDQYISIEINGQRQNIRYPFSENAKNVLSQAIFQLSSRANHWVTFIEGHGEASPFGKTNRDLSKLYQTLKALGWPIAAQNLTKQPEISSNTKLLVIAGGQTKWLPSEVYSLVDYLAKGGNLLVLLEESSKLPRQLSSLLALKRLKGTLIDWQGYQSGTPHPAIVIVNQFEKHPVNAGIDSLLAFPWSTGLEIVPTQQNKAYDYRTILKTNQGVWTEFNSQQEQLAFNADQGEKQGRFLLGYSIENNLPVSGQPHSQRLVVIGDSSFLSDAAINNYQNQQFALNLINWLSSQPLSKAQGKKQDSFIAVTPSIHFLLKWGYSLGLPMLFLALMAATKWFKRHG